MKHLLFLFAFWLLMLVPANAQDLIEKKSGDVIECKIVSSNGDKVRFFMNHDPNYAYSLNKSEIQMIRYSSGEVVSVNTPSQCSALKMENGTQKMAADMSIVPYMSYRQLRRIYDFREYERSYMDRFNPGWVGLASFLLPGLGECICDEWGRGLGKFFGVAACSTAGTLFLTSYTGTGIACATIFYAAALSLDIWSIIDARRISKVRNMYESDMREKYAFDLNLFPSVNCARFGNKTQPTVGLTLAMRF